MGITPRTRQQIAAEAVDWFLWFQETTAGEPERQGFSEWLLRSPVHIEEYLRVSCAWNLTNVGAEGVDALVAAAKAHHESDNVVALPGRSGRRPPEASSEASRGVSRRSWPMALAASLLLGIVLSVTYLSWKSPMTFQTVIGQQSSFTLQDGSVVFLNTNSKVRVESSTAERHIELVRGEARFKVAKDAGRPFTVGTATAAVRALGTV